eukprot:1736379-Prymnesium_polylepis.1
MLPTSGMEGCTAVPIELRCNPALREGEVEGRVPVYVGHIELIGLDDWRRELEQLIDMCTEVRRCSCPGPAWVRPRHHHHSLAARTRTCALQLSFAATAPAPWCTARPALLLGGVVAGHTSRVARVGAAGRRHLPQASVEEQGGPRWMAEAAARLRPRRS